MVNIWIFILYDFSLSVFLEEFCIAVGFVDILGIVNQVLVDEVPVALGLALKVQIIDNLVLVFFVLFIFVGISIFLIIPIIFLFLRRLKLGVVPFELSLLFLKLSLLLYFVLVNLDLPVCVPLAYYPNKPEDHHYVEIPPE